jgi:uncharacterized protein (DUF1330 family)
LGPSINAIEIPFVPRTFSNPSVVVVCGAPRIFERNEMKKGYWVVAYRSILDESALIAYGKLAIPAVQAGGGKPIIRQSEVHPRESGLNQRVVVIEFETLEIAVATYNSPAYHAALRVLGAGAERDCRIVEGV